MVRTDVLMLAGITVAGAILRFYGLGEWPLWYDEAVIYHIVQGGWREILTNNALGNSAPPLYALALGLLTGPDASEAMLRSLGAVASVAAIPLCYLLAREFVSSRLALLAPVLIAVAPIQLSYAQQLREYSLSVAVAAAMMLIYVRYIRAPTARNAVKVAVIAILALVTQYGLALMLTALNLVLIASFLLNKRSLRDYGNWVLTQLPAAIVAGILFVTVVQYQQANVNVSATVGYLAIYHGDGTAQGLWELFASPPHNLIVYALPGELMMLLVAVGLIGSLMKSEAALAAAVLLAPVAVTYGMAVLGIYPYGAVRQDLFLTPMIYVMAVIGLAQLAALVPRTWPGPVKPSVLVLLSLILAAPALFISMNRFNAPVPEGTQSMRATIGTLAENLLPNDKIYVYHSAIPAFRYYWRGQTAPWIAGSLHRSWMDDRVAAEQAKTVIVELRKLVSSGQRTWILLSHLEVKYRDQFATALSRSGRMHVMSQGDGTVLLLMNGPLMLRNDSPAALSGK